MDRIYIATADINLGALKQLLLGLEVSDEIGDQLGVSAGELAQCVRELAGCLEKDRRVDPNRPNRVDQTQRSATAGSSGMAARNQLAGCRSILSPDELHFLLN